MIILQITEDAVRILCGRQPRAMVWAEKKRASADQLVADISDVRARCKIHDRQCRLVISRREVVFKRMQLPSIDQQEILRMIRLQIPALVPVETHQTVYDYQVICAADSQCSTVGVVVALKDCIQHDVSAAQSAGMMVSSVMVNTDGIDYCARLLLPNAFWQDGCSVLIAWDCHSAEALFFVDRQGVFSFHISYGYGDLEARAEEVAEAVCQCIAVFENSDDGSAIKRLWLSGVGAAGDDLSHQLRLRRPWEVECFNLVAALAQMPKVPASVQEMDCGWLPLIGCLMKDSDAQHINLLPVGARLSQDRRRWRCNVASFCAAVLALVVLSSGLGWAILDRQAQYVQKIEHQADTLGAQLEGMQSEEKFFQMQVQRFGDGTTVIGMLGTLYQLLPDGISVQSLGMNSRGVFDFQGVAHNDHHVGRLQEALASSESFRAVELQYATQRRRFDHTYTEFKLILYPQGVSQ